MGAARPGEAQPLTLASVKVGDTFRIDGERYRAMIEFRDGWYCRRWEDESWSHEHHWFTIDREIEDHGKYIPESLAGGNESVDPLAR